MRYAEDCGVRSESSMNLNSSARRGKKVPARIMQNRSTITLLRCRPELMSPKGRKGIKNKMKIEIFKGLRKPESHARYLQFIRSGKLPKCYLCGAKPVKDYKYWKIVENEFPYDEVAETTHIVSPKRHLTETGLTWREMSELQNVKDDIHKEYDMILENAHKNKLIPGHYHLQLLKLKERMLVMPETGLDQSVRQIVVDRSAP